MQLTIYGELGKFDWRVSSNQPDRIKFPRTSGVVEGQTEVRVNIIVPSGLPLGENHLGNIIVKITQDNGFNQTETIPVKVKVMRELRQSHLPMIR